VIVVLVKGPSQQQRPPGPPVTVPFDQKLRTGSDDIPLDQLAKKGGQFEPEQIHLGFAGQNAVFVSWATHNATIVSTKSEISPPDLATVASQVQWGTSRSDLSHTASGDRTNYIGDYEGAQYVSGIFHHVKVEVLQPEVTYFYRCGDAAKAWSEVMSFKMPKAVGPESFPQSIGIIGDLGQTYNSSSTLDHLIANDPAVVFLVGDYSYSDHYTPQGKTIKMSGPWPTDFVNSYQPRWDSWGRLTQPAFSQRLLMGLHGNHEVERDLSNNSFQAYTNRYRYPHIESGSTSPHYYSFDLAGAHVIHAGSYVDFGPGSPQYQWLQQDLAAFSRERTPWLIVNFHAPWYHNYIAHYKEANCHQLAVEEMLHKAGVDMVFTGHVHAYSATNKIFNWTLENCGTHHIVIGDGGNVERLYTKWVDEGPENCPDPATVACPTFQGGRFCPDRQPSWSAFREPSFGHGILTLHSATKAVWQWHRNQDGAAVVSHEMHIQRDTGCSNQRKV